MHKRVNWVWYSGECKGPGRGLCTVCWHHVSDCVSPTETFPGHIVAHRVFVGISTQPPRAGHNLCITSFAVLMESFNPACWDYKNLVLSLAYLSLLISNFLVVPGDFVCSITQLLSSLLEIRSPRRRAWIPASWAPVRWWETQTGS